MGKIDVKSVVLFFPIKTARNALTTHKCVFLSTELVICDLNRNCLYGRSLVRPPNNIWGARSGVGQWRCVAREVDAHMWKGSLLTVWPWRWNHVGNYQSAQRSISSTCPVEVRSSRVDACLVEANTKTVVTRRSEPLKNESQRLGGQLGTTFC